MKETVEYYINNESNVYATLLDCSKAFDKVKHDVLFKILVNANICPLILKLLINMYLQMKGKVCWNGEYSNIFSVFNGVKQGGVISPVLFSLYMDGLIKNVHNSKTGCFVGNKPPNILSMLTILFCLVLQYLL